MDDDPTFPGLIETNYFPLLDSIGIQLTKSVTNVDGSASLCVECVYPLVQAIG